ncbi:unnamed protein product [Cyclocybe aegerita]|uniref:F-box domain-containing protein n=1 Tax=Cyclocybe aegerita TaxID=1973307 RepID=A0A8S0WTE0_CYCAE|nr:unnamed protein product [Cyclocybe aegerita]
MHESTTTVLKSKVPLSNDSKKAAGNRWFLDALNNISLQASSFQLRVSSRWKSQNPGVIINIVGPLIAILCNTHPSSTYTSSFNTSSLVKHPVSGGATVSPGSDLPAVLKLTPNLVHLDTPSPYERDISALPHGADDTAPGSRGVDNRKRVVLIPQLHTYRFRPRRTKKAFSSQANSPASPFINIMQTSPRAYPINPPQRIVAYVHPDEQRLCRLHEVQTYPYTRDPHVRPALLYVIAQGPTLSSPHRYDHPSLRLFSSLLEPPPALYAAPTHFFSIGARPLFLAPKLRLGTSSAASRSLLETPRSPPSALDHVLQCCPFFQSPLTMPDSMSATTVLKFEVPPSSEKASNSNSRRRNRVISLFGPSSKPTTATLPDSPFPHLLNSNTAPSPSEEAQILALIARVESERTQLQNGSHHAWDRSARRKLERLGTFMNALRTVLAPIRRLPPELLCEVFSHLQPLSSHTPEQVGLLSTPPTLGRFLHDIFAISHVCVSWRALALATPSLWTSLPPITLQNHKTAPARDAAALVCLRTVLKRSTAAPLAVSLSTLSAPETRAMPVLALVAARAEQWESLTLDTHARFLPALACVRGRLPLLRKLTLNIWDHTASSNTSVDPEPYTMFEDAPLLRSVTLKGLRRTQIALPYAHLTSFRDATHTHSALLQVLNQAGCSLLSLSALSLENCPPFPAVTLYGLRKLQVVFSHSGASPDALNNLSLPAIESIEIAGPAGDIVGSLIVILSNTDEPSPLRYLAFRSATVPPGSLTALLKLTPNLEYLDASIPHESDIAALAHGADDTPSPSPRGAASNQKRVVLAPHLHTCRFFINANFIRAEMCEAMDALVEARCELPHRAEGYVQLIPGELRRLENLSLYYEDLTLGPTQQTYLHALYPAKIATELEGLRVALYQSEVGSGSRHGQRERASTGAMKRAGVVLGALEGMQVEDKNATNLYTQALHLTLQNLACSPFTSSSGHGLAKRAAAILRRWDGVFGGPLVTRKWVFRGVHYLDYLPRDEVYTSKRDETWRDASVRWPAQIAFKN